MVSEACPACGAQLDNEELHLTDTTITFPLLGRELSPDSPKRTCLQLFTCSADGSRWAGWLDQPDEGLRRIELNSETMRWWVE
jgi:hypothetical protein